MKKVLLGTSALALVGAVTFALSDRNRERLILPLVAFSAGSLLGGALLHMIPEAVERSGGAATVSLWVLVGFTPGKGLLGLRILRADGQRIGLGRAIVRYAGYWVSLIFLGLGFIWILFDRRRRGWHDKLAGTCVVYFDKDFTFFRK